ncbi:uncharacterized protein LOC106646048 [Copidosoma floridanum]|uniref:uncharacterized protein LOC106646048 n=1 Tax=Copidosoma floridanum TaxID=29053 RepID=UPI0006C98A06|nr:uncharacterized protein LOC106646048 [Copidosoma floridanum]
MPFFWTYTIKLRVKTTSELNLFPRPIKTSQATQEEDNQAMKEENGNSDDDMEPLIFDDESQNQGLVENIENLPSSVVRHLPSFSTSDSSLESEVPGTSNQTDVIVRFYCKNCRRRQSITEITRDMLVKCKICSKFMQCQCPKCDKFFNNSMIAFKHVTRNCFHQAAAPRQLTLTEKMEKIKKRKLAWCDWCKKNFEDALQLAKHQVDCPVDDSDSESD